MQGRHAKLVSSKGRLRCKRGEDGKQGDGGVRTTRREAHGWAEKHMTTLNMAGRECRCWGQEGVGRA